MTRPVGGCLIADCEAQGRGVGSRSASFVLGLGEGVVEAHQLRDLPEERTVLLSACHRSCAQGENCHAFAVRMGKMGVHLEKRILRKPGFDSGDTNGLTDRHWPTGQFGILDVSVLLCCRHRTSSAHSRRRYFDLSPRDGEKGEQGPSFATLGIVTVQAERAVTGPHLAQGQKKLLALRQLRDELLAGDAVRDGFDQRCKRDAQFVGLGRLRRGEKSLDRQLGEASRYGKPDAGVGVLDGIIEDERSRHEHISQAQVTAGQGGCPHVGLVQCLQRLHPSRRANVGLPQLPSADEERAFGAASHHLPWGQQRDR